MLKTRLLTIIILVPLLVWGIYCLPTPWLTGLLTVIVGWMAWEWSRLSGITTNLFRCLFTLVCLLVCVFMWLRPLGLLPLNAPLYWLILADLAWILALSVVVTYARGGTPAWCKNPGWLLLMGVVILTAVWLGLRTLITHRDGRDLLLYALLIVWFADSFAYVAGRLWGARPLAKLVSPKKSWEGVIGGLVACIVLALVASPWLHVTGKTWLALGVLTFWTGCWSVVGDLFESVLKRLQGIKDSGTLIPGHGGILDRTDALLAAVPWFVSGLIIINYFMHTGV